MTEGSSAPEHSTKGLREFIDKAKQIEATRKRGTKDAVLRTQIEIEQKEKQAAQSETEKQRKKAEKAEENSMLDTLTKLPNKKWFDQQLSRAHARYKRYDKPYWLIFIDIDEFAKINEDFGHERANDVLREFGKIGSREEDPVARYGGEEFTQILQDATGLEEIEQMLQRYSANFKKASKTVLGREATLSFGVAKVENEETSKSVIERADNAMYRSKKKGRDQAHFISGSPDESPIYTKLELNLQKGNSK